MNFDDPFADSVHNGDCHAVACLLVKLGVGLERQNDINPFICPSLQPQAFPWRQAADALERERYYAMRNEYLRTKRLDVSLEELSGADYFFMVYAYGHDFYAKLVNEIGSGAFYEGLKTYYNANYMGIGTKEKLIAAFSEAAGRDLTEWFEANIAPEAAQ